MAALSKVDELKRRGNLLYVLGDYTAALNHYRSAMDPLRDYKAAHETDLDAACTAAELLVSLLLNTAACALAKPAEGHAAAAKQAAGTALEVLPQTIPRHRVSVDQMQASDASEKLLALAAKGYYRRGVAEMRLGEYDEARSDLEQASQLQPESTKAPEALKRLEGLESERFAPALALGDAAAPPAVEHTARPWCWVTRSATPSVAAAAVGLDALALASAHLFGRPQDIPESELALLSEGGVILDFSGRGGTAEALRVRSTAGRSDAVATVLELVGTRGLEEAEGDTDYWEVFVNLTTPSGAAAAAGVSNGADADAPIELRIGVQGATLALRVARGAGGGASATARGDATWSVAIGSTGALVVALLLHDGALRYRCSWRAADGAADALLFAASAALPAERPLRPAVAVASRLSMASLGTEASDATSAASLLLRHSTAAAGFASVALTLRTPFVKELGRSTAADARAAPSVAEVLAAFAPTSCVAAGAPLLVAQMAPPDASLRAALASGKSAIAARIDGAAAATAAAPALGKYATMLKAGLPEAAVRQKMSMERVAAADVEAFFAAR